jgi:hypothetical protein
MTTSAFVAFNGEAQGVSVDALLAKAFCQSSKSVTALDCNFDTILPVTNRKSIKRK